MLRGYKQWMSDAADPKELVKKFITQQIPHNRAIGMELLDFESGWALGKVPYREEFVGNPFTGVIHGGVVTTLLDSLGGLAAGSAARYGGSLATLDLRIDYLRPSKPGHAVIGRVECFKITRNVAFTRGTAHDGDEKDPVASMTATYIFSNPQPASDKSKDTTP